MVDLPASGADPEEWQHKIHFPEDRSLHHVMDEVISALCKEALRRTGGAKNRAAEILGISRDSLYRYMKRFNDSEDAADSTPSTDEQPGKT